MSQSSDIKAQKCLQEFANYMKELSEEMEEIREFMRTQKNRNNGE